MSKQKRSLFFGCFTPQVMVATFVIEVILFIYTFIRYKINNVGRVILAIIICLASFQAAEYLVCTQGTLAILASRAGFVAITFLPSLGLYLMSLLTKPLSKKTLKLLFTGTGLIAAYFLLAPQAFNSYNCTGNYVIFQMGLVQSYAYGLFYHGLLLLTILRGVLFLRTNQKTSKTSPVKFLLLGYLVFMAPVAVITMFHPPIIQAIPSVLCGFALLYAVILVTCLAPSILKKR